MDAIDQSNFFQRGLIGRAAEVMSQWIMFDQKGRVGLFCFVLLHFYQQPFASSSSSSSLPAPISHRCICIQQSDVTAAQQRLVSHLKG